jgi:hypothetical protein
LYAGGGSYGPDGLGDPNGPGYIARGRVLQQQGGGMTWIWDTVSCDRTVFALAEFQDANDPAPMLYAAGMFTVVDGVAADYVARWDPNAPGGPAWAPVGPNEPNHPGDVIYALAVYQPTGGTPMLCAAGAGGVYKWQNNAWSHLLSDNSVCYALAEYEDPNAVWLYAGGAPYFRRWIGTGTNWEVLLDMSGAGGSVRALHVHDEGPGEGFSGPGLYVGGYHPYGGHLSRYDGTWHFYPVGDHVLALETFDDELGDRPALYVGGHLHTGGVDENYQDSDYIARWGCGGIVQWGETGGE